MTDARPGSTAASARRQDAIEDRFNHGASYPPENGLIRRSPCASCAFISDAASVRGSDISIQELETTTAEMDDFLCHCTDGNGEVFTCAGWAARFGADKPEVQAKTLEAEA